VPTDQEVRKRRLCCGMCNKSSLRIRSAAYSIDAAQGSVCSFTSAPEPTALQMQFAMQRAMLTRTNMIWGRRNKERMRCVIDVHCHILPGVDDGADSLETALAMARRAVADGITAIVATPHYNVHWCVQSDRVRASIAMLRNALHDASIPLHVFPGNEVRLDDVRDVLQDLDADAFCTLADKRRYVLLEQPWTAYAPHTLAVIAQLLERGIRAIVPHPERHSFLREDVHLLQAMVDAGAWLQVTADSLLGNNGNVVQTAAWDVVDRGWAHVIATDAHNVKRAPTLANASRLIAERIGAQKVEDMWKRAEQVIA
jgi:protein-tyrosine phosphatase